jgi:hypothetical protein
VNSAESRAPGSHPETERFLRALRDEFPRFRIVSKRESPLSQLIDRLLKLITLGGQRHYLTRYHTVIGDTLYVPEVWASMTDQARVILLRHERIHLLQRRRYGFPLFAFLYLVPFLPLGLAYFRARLEWEAYRETLRATGELRGRAALHAPELRQSIVERFTGPDYGWMWPFPRSVNRWFDQAVMELEPSFSAEQHP